MPSTTEERQCWICLETETVPIQDEDGLPQRGRYQCQVIQPGGSTSSTDHNKRWCHPCRCRGGSKWVHQACLLQWIHTLHTANPSAALPRHIEHVQDDRGRAYAVLSTSAACPQCNTPYRLRVPTPSTFHTTYAHYVRAYTDTAAPTVVFAALVAAGVGAVWWYGVVATYAFLGIGWKVEDAWLAHLRDVGGVKGLVASMTLQEEAEVPPSLEETTDMTLNEQVPAPFMDVNGTGDVIDGNRDMAQLDESDMASCMTLSEEALVHQAKSAFWMLKTLDHLRHQSSLIIELPFVLLAARYGGLLSGVIRFGFFVTPFYATLRQSLRAITEDPAMTIWWRLGRWCVQPEVMLCAWPWTSRLYGALRRRFRRWLFQRLQPSYRTLPVSSAASMPTLEPRREDDAPTMLNDMPSMLNDSPHMPDETSSILDNATPTRDDTPIMFDDQPHNEDIEDEAPDQEMHVPDIIRHHLSIITGALAYPFLCHTMGNLLFRQSLPALLRRLSHSKLLQRLFMSPATSSGGIRSFFKALTPFHQNFLGGCMVIVVKDCLEMVYAYQQRQVKLSRRVLDFDEVEMAAVMP